MIISTDEYKRKIRPRVVLSATGEPDLAEEWDYEPEIPDEFLSDEEIARRAAELIYTKPSEFTSFAVRVPDKISHKHVNFSFAKRRYLQLPYDTQQKRVIFKCGRQVEKSTTIGNKLLSFACINTAFNILYVSPTNQQTKTFSQDRLKEPIETSDILRAWTTTKLSDNVFLKKFINRSQITLRYAFHNADRVRGIPADMVCIDEIQDVITDNIPVIEECASHSPWKIFLYSGTPKSFDNAIEYYWSRFSTQNEWVVPCDRHGLPGDPSTWYWNVLGEENIQKQGLSCAKCGHLLDAMRPEAQWASMNPGVRGRLAEPYEGFRIPQLMVPWLPWSEIYQKYISIDRAVFYNEVLGLSYDSGTRPLSRQDVIDNCVPGLLMTQSVLDEIKSRLGTSFPVFCGIDWGTGEGTYTVLSLAAYINGVYTVFFVHRFEGQELEPPVQLEIIDRILAFWDVKITGVDYGGGYDRNDHLVRKWGKNKIAKYQYSQPGQKVKWDENLHRFLVHRTEVMSDVFNAIKRRNVFRFPDWQHFEDPFGNDFLSIFSEYNENLRQIQYKKTPDSTDDAFHSILFGFLASMLYAPRMDVINPNAKTGSDGDD